MDYDQIYQDFVGKDKVQPLSISQKKSGAWVLKYREGKLIRDVECSSRDDLDKILVGFGGKNPETCKTDSKFLELTGEWGSEELNILGHRITKIQLDGLRISRIKIIPFILPEGTGQKSAMASKRRLLDEITLRLRDREESSFTRSFDKIEEFDALVTFLKSHPSLKDLRWFVKLIGTESKSTGKQCVWKRVQAGDGTKRMVLELRKLDGKSFKNCVRKDVFDSAGDMFDTPCRRISVRRKGSGEQNICLFAAEDGLVDISNFEVIT